MAENSGIEWTDHTFNPWMGCTKVSPACKNCYAERDFDHRYGKVQWGPQGTRVMTSAANWRNPIKWNAEAKRRGVRFRVFCASLADVFEDWKGPIVDSNGETVRWDATLEGPNRWKMGADGKGEPVYMNDLRLRLFALIDQTPNLDWLILTKRPENIARMWGWGGSASEPMRRHNVWLGTSVENQEQADKRIGELIECRSLAPVLFLSCEPLLGPVNLRGFGTMHAGRELVAPHFYRPWVIAGGESGPGARPTHPNWICSLRDQCESVGIPFHFKQWGEWLPISEASISVMTKAPQFAEIGILSSGKSGAEVTREVCDAEQDLPMLMYRVGKKSAGRMLEDRTWDGVPGLAKA